MNATQSLDRRSFLKGSAASLAATALGSSNLFAESKQPLYKISLAEWSLHKAIQKGEMTNLEFAAFAKKEGMDGIEYVNNLFKDRSAKQSYLDEVKKRADDNGVKSLLIMCDSLGNLGDPAEEGRDKTVENHKPWLEAAKFLGCHSIRVNAASKGTRDEQVKLAADGLRRLSEVAKPMDLNVIVENHGGWSSDGAWLAEVMRTVNLPNCGTLPDFGNFHVGDGKWYDRYKGVEELMPFAKAVSAKSNDFDDEGNETKTDYTKMMQIVLDAGYRGYVGIEYEGSKLSEPDGIRATKKLLERVRETIKVKA